MAKIGRKRGLDRAAVGIGTALANVVNRLERWREQRDEIAAEVREIVATGSRLLAELGHDATIRVSDARAELSRRRGGRPKGFKLSAATKRKLREAWRRRRAAAGSPLAAARPGKRGPRRKGQLSPEARERIAAAQRKRWAAYRAAKKG